MVCIITIDGPSASGKGTIAKILAHKLHWNLLDSGSLYRLLVLAAHSHNIALNDEQKLANLVDIMDVKFLMPEDVSEDLQVYLDGKLVNQEIREENIGLQASVIATFQQVRSKLEIKQRNFAQEPGLVADGRDMGTVIFPQAKIKFFLTASLQERAKRRFQQLQQKKVQTSLQQVQQDVKLRDEYDRQRTISPLKPANDAIILDSTELQSHEVLHNIIDILSFKGII